jgi:hypothetical protein
VQIVEVTSDCEAFGSIAPKVQAAITRENPSCLAPHARHCDVGGWHA